MIENFIDILKTAFDHPLFTLGNSRVTLSSICSVLIWMILVILISRVIKWIFKRWIISRLGLDVGTQEVIARLINYFFATVGTLIVFQVSGINISSLNFIAGGLGVGIGIGLQSITRDFISGFIVLFDRSIKVHDYIQFIGKIDVENIKGTVKEIALLFTKLRHFDGGTIIVPNTYMVTYPVMNWSYNQAKNRLRIPLRVKQGIDLVLFTDIVLNTVYAEPTAFDEPPPRLIFKRYGENYWEFEIRVWIQTIRDDDDTYSPLYYAIEYNLRQHGIEVRYPTHELSIHRDNVHLLTKMLDEEQSDEFDRPSRRSDSQVVFKELSTQPLSARDLLQKVTYFRNFTELELRKLIEIGQRIRLEEREILFNEGDPGDAFYIILSGSVEVYVPKINKRLTILKAGTFFGELSLMLGIPRTASVRAEETTILFAINNRGFKQLINEQPDLADVIVKELGKHQEELAQRQQQLREMGLIDADEDDTNLVLWVRKRLNKLFG